MRLLFWCCPLIIEVGKLLGIHFVKLIIEQKVFLKRMGRWFIGLNGGGSLKEPVFLRSKGWKILLTRGKGLTFRENQWDIPFSFYHSSNKHCVGRLVNKSKIEVMPIFFKAGFTSNFEIRCVGRRRLAISTLQ